jgi:formylglycine-generating enzyme required for sulfatase activity
LAVAYLGGKSPLLMAQHLVAPKNAASVASFRDCDLCPEMVALSAGDFMMGSPDSEAGREGQEGPPRRVVLTKPFAIGRFEITIDQFAAFVAETGFEVGEVCRAFVLGARPSEWAPVSGSFRAPGFRVTGTHPAVCVSWHDAKAYTKWLAGKTGRPYRLPTEAEWEYAARAGTRSAFSFGNDMDQLCEFARFADGDSSFPWRSGCHSGTFEPGALRVGMLAPNPWGLSDMHGNVWEWTEDCWTSEPRLLPVDGSAYTRQEDCELRSMRGGGWGAERRRVRSAERVSQFAAARYYHIGFRVVLPLSPQ